MRRIAPLLLALLLLPACGRAMPEPPATTTAEIESTTEAETTTEPKPTEAPFVPASGESNGVRWRTLDLEDAANAEVKEELLQLLYEKTEHQLGTDKKIILEKPTYQLVMVEDNGKRTVLLPRRGSEDYGGTVASFIAALDDRYFLFCRGSVDDLCGFGIYDTKELREIPLEIAQEMWGCLGARGNLLYFTDFEQYGCYKGRKHLWVYDWQAIVCGEPANAVDLLAGFAGPDANQIAACRLTDDARYFFVPEEEGLRIYDLAAKKLLTTLLSAEYAGNDFHPYYLHEWNNTIYWFDYNEYYNNNYALEITLP
ncbi:MAG: hypothetical protein FWF60_00420 [Oscillospiraceae bacterium]|nr:hypothetical protein [Oscillospiraceae bacterium]